MDPSLLSLRLEETRLITALSSIRSQLNEYAPISTLPPEILEHIFTLCIPWLFHPQRNSHPLAWTQACRKWRNISINAPRLWSYIDVCDNRLAAECLVRSANAPIHVISSSLYWRCTTDETLLVPHFERINSINVLLFPEGIAQLFSKCPSLPNLITLSLKVPPIASNFLLDLSPMYLPSLRRLTLWSVSVPWTMCVGLTYLHLRGLVAGYSPIIEQLLDVLKASPCIEEIHFEHVTPTDSGLLHNQTPYSHYLPSLHHLHLTSKPPFKIHTLLSYLVLPSSAHLSISCPHFERLHDLFPDTAPETLFPHLSSEKIMVAIDHWRDLKGLSLFTSQISSASSIRHSKFMSIYVQCLTMQSFLSDIVSFFNISCATILDDFSGGTVSAFL
ncbi:hypothetical protein C0989_001587 [Termitomyces sp. Mn162]|nr:hypothetical protein C0989_001587 [Termitomyces sp. Mn162]